MIKTAVILSLFFACGFNISSAAAIGLDEIYRDIVRSDNRGYLPLYIKNREAPDFLFDDAEIKKSQQDQEIIPTSADENLMIDFQNHRLLRELEKKEAEQRWQQTLDNVKKNRVTPADLNEIETRAAQNDPIAVEVNAFMFARGIGVKPDMIKAFHLYQQAAKLNIPHAEENAAKVYKAMTPAQKETLSPFHN